MATTHPEWDKTTSGLEVASAFADQIKGRYIAITGVSPNSLGESTALALASQSPAVLILASRSQERMDAVAAGIRASSCMRRGGGGTVDIRTVVLNLASQRSVRRAAAEISAAVPRLDLLINNAGVTTMTRQHTEEGVEMQFGANHVGHFLLTSLLLPLLEVSAACSIGGGGCGSAKGLTRVVNLTSKSHRLSPMRFHDFNIEGKAVPPEELSPVPLAPAFARQTPDGYQSILAYAQSKTANILFTLSLQERLGRNGICSYAVHPGSTTTNLGREQDEEFATAIANTIDFWKTHDQGASTTLVAALDPKLSENNGLYLLDCQFGQAAPHAADPGEASKLWKLSEELIGQGF
ncbi:hypothetical protein BX600DRAFT_505361 [Xylariales sp. PMI_506]|nr:hypothetical protein BX600DRAFT_505361 [Xylariales sp. PMI_506]